MITRQNNGYKFDFWDWMPIIIEHPKRQISYTEAVKVYNQFRKNNHKI